MRSTKFMILLVLLFIFSLALASCADPGSDKPGEVETAPEDETGLDGGWMPDDTPPYAYAQAMRERLDPVIEEAFGIAEVHYYTDEMTKVHGEGIYHVRYVLVEAPPHDEFAFYYILDDVLKKAFDFSGFEDCDEIECYLELYGDEIPDHINAGILFEGDKHYFWEVFYDGTYLGFYTF